MEHRKTSGEVLTTDSFVFYKTAQPNGVRCVNVGCHNYCDPLMITPFAASYEIFCPKCLKEKKDAAPQ